MIDLYTCHSFCYNYSFICINKIARSISQSLNKDNSDFILMLLAFNTSISTLASILYLCDIYTDVNLQKTTKLFLKSFVYKQDYD